MVRIETGIAVSEIRVVRQFNRNANSTTATTIAASTSTRSTLRIDVSMKFDCRKMIWSAFMPFGSEGVISASACSISRVSRTVSISGCFSTETTTAGDAMYPESPRLTLAANSTVATCHR